MNEFPDGTVAPAARRARFYLRKTFRYLGYGILGSFLAVIIVYNYCMRPAFLQPIIIEQFAKATNGKLDMTLEKTSLFTGFRLRNVNVYPPEGYKDTPVLRAGEINLLYNVFGFFRGKFGVHEISLNDTEIFLEQKNDVFNIEALLKPSVKKPKPEEDEKEPGDGIFTWFFDVQVFARVALKNFNFSLDALDKSNRNRQYAHLKNFNFSLSVLTNDFNKINTNDIPGLISLLNTFVIQLSPQKTISVAYEGRDRKSVV